MNPSSTQPSHRRESPSAAILLVCLLLAGFATALLGPILPLLSLRWHLSDQQSGLLLLAQFCGATTGGLTVSRVPSRSLKRGLLAAAAAFFAFAFAPRLPLACVTLFAAGWGAGQLITAGNIITGRRYEVHRGAALALFNFSFSLGAMFSPLCAAWLTPVFALRSLLAAFASCFLFVLCSLSLQPHARPSEEAILTTPNSDQSRLSLRIYLYFSILLFLYGGVETSVDGWLTTFALRYGSRTLVLSEYTTLILWASLTAGRALSSLLLLSVGERRLRTASLLLTVACILALIAAHGALAIALLAALLGLSLAPFFPCTFALLIADRPSARQAGVILAVSGLGAALLPSLMGVVSTRSGSLQIALVIPLAAASLLLVLSSVGNGPDPAIPPRPEPSST